MSMKNLFPLLSVPKCTFSRDCTSYSASPIRST